MITVQVRTDRRTRRMHAARFLYFGDADDDGRGKVLHLRRDGDYGFVEAA
jgi:hypothetical protein